MLGFSRVMPHQHGITFHELRVEPKGWSVMPCCQGITYCNNQSSHVRQIHWYGGSSHFSTLSPNEWRGLPYAWGCFTMINIHQQCHHMLRKGRSHQCFIVLGFGFWGHCFVAMPLNNLTPCRLALLLYITLWIVVSQPHIMLFYYLVKCNFMWEFVGYV
jgi:hypothetical protein